MTSKRARRARAAKRKPKKPGLIRRTVAAAITDATKAKPVRNHKREEAYDLPPEALGGKPVSGTYTDWTRFTEEDREAYRADFSGSIVEFLVWPDDNRPLEDLARDAVVERYGVYATTLALWSIEAINGPARAKLPNPI
jgi:hypothetical protein